MTTREKVVITVGCAALVIALFVSFIAVAGGDDSSTVACSSGQWVHATVTKANGEKLSAENRRQLPKGYSATTQSGDQKITINDDGSVTAEGGAVTVECVTPTK